MWLESECTMEKEQILERVNDVETIQKIEDETMKRKAYEKQFLVGKSKKRKHSDSR